jgi:hypothetical protein
VWILSQKLQPDAVDAVLTVPEEDQLARPESGSLPAQLGADGAAGTGDEDGFPPQVAGAVIP